MHFISKGISGTSSKRLAKLFFGGVGQKRPQQNIIAPRLQANVIVIQRHSQARPTAVCQLLLLLHAISRLKPSPRNSDLISSKVPAPLQPS